MGGEDIADWAMEINEELGLNQDFDDANDDDLQDPSIANVGSALKDNYVSDKSANPEHWVQIENEPSPSAE